VQFKESVLTSCFFHTYRISVDEHDIEFDDIEVDVLLNKHMPEILPIKGNRIKFYYPGIKPLCIRCYTSGHNKWECNKKDKTNWLDFVIKFYKSEEVSDDMLGSWVETLKTYHPELNKKKPIWGNKNEDLRDNLDENKAYHQRQANARGRSQGRGRGRGRGQGQNRERGKTDFESSQSQPQTSKKFHTGGRGNRGSRGTRGGRGGRGNPKFQEFY